MKTGKTITELAQELLRVQESKRDFVVPTAKLRMDAGATIAIDGIPGSGTEHFEPNNWAHQQLSAYTGIPRAYYEQIRKEAPELLARNVNHGLRKHEVDEKGKGDTRMIRTIDGKVRGFLSSKYRRLDNHDLIEAVLPLAIDAGMEVKSCELTEQKMYLQLSTPKLAGEIQKGDVVNHGLVISSSDVGAGSVRVEPLLFRLVCLNGLIMPTALRKFHIGRDQAEGDVYEILSDKTKELSDAAFFASVRDIVANSLKPEVFEREINRVRDTTEQRITKPDLEEVVELTMRAVGVSGEGNKSGILNWLASGNEGAGLTKWGLINSFTRQAAAEEVDYDQSIDLQRAAGKIITLPKSEWRRIADKVAAG